MKVGDKVRLRTGGPFEMEVTVIYDDKIHVGVLHRHNDEEHEMSVPIELLEVVPHD